MGLSKQVIAKRLGKDRSSIYRELARNGEGKDYAAGLAQQKAQARHQTKRIGKIDRDGKLRWYITTSLEKGWSPEQIAGCMKHQHLTFYACHETIYQFIYQSNDKTLFHLLTYKKPKRQRRYARRRQACRYGAIRLIDERPKDIEMRKRFGHWEGDTIQFKGQREKVVTTLVERKSRMLMMIKNPSKHSKGVMEKIQKKFSSLPEKMFKTITFDQGSEFAYFHLLEKQNNARQIYYCHAHSPWQKGSNENMNGRLRRYLPRETNIANMTQDDLDALAHKMNLCPRKCLGYKTPQELFIQQYKNDCRTWS